MPFLSNHDHSSKDSNDCVLKCFLVNSVRFENILELIRAKINAEPSRKVSCPSNRLMLTNGPLREINQHILDRHVE